MSAMNIPEETDPTIKTFFKAVFGSTNLDEVYNDYAVQYDTIIKTIGGQGHTLVADELIKLYKEDASSKLILDVGSGTGLLGKGLSERGFKHIHALDISQASLEEAQKKNVYEDFILSGITNDPTPGIAENTYDATVSSGCFVPGGVTNDPTPGIAENTYDATVSSGCFVPGHIKINALEELCRITKQGGLIVITICDTKFEMGFMEGLNEIMKTYKAELQSMQLVPYRIENTENSVKTNAYLVVLKVL